jgi:hypothetical protein
VKAAATRRQVPVMSVAMQFGLPERKSSRMTHLAESLYEKYFRPLQR